MKQAGQHVHTLPNQQQQDSDKILVKQNTIWFLDQFNWQLEQQTWVADDQQRHVPDKKCVSKLLTCDLAPTAFALYSK